MADLERFLREFMAKDHDSLVMDDDKWITIHPNGTDNRAVMIDDKTGVIKKGLAIGLIGTKLKDIRDNFKNKAKIEQHKARAEGEKTPEVKENRDQKFADLLKLIRSIHHKTYVYDKDKLRGMSTEDLIDDLNAEFKTTPEIAKGIEKELRADRNLDEDDITDLIDKETDKYIRKKCAEFAENDPLAKDFRDELKEIQEKYLPQIKELNKEVGEVVTKDQYQKADDLRRAYSKEKNELDDKFKDKLDVPYTVPTQYWYDNKTDQQDNEIIKLSQDVTNSYLNQEKARKKAENIFRKISPAGKFFGEKGMRKVSNKYFSINHNPDKDTVILDNVNDRLRVTGRGDLVFLTDKNKGIYVNEKNSLPILTYNEDDNTHSVHMAVKFNRKYAKEYQFKNDFDGTDDLKPVNGFEGLQEIAKEKDKNILNTPSYRNVNSKEVPFYRAEFLDNLSSIQQMIRKASVKTVTTGGTAGEIEKFISQGWNGKVYSYKNGDNAIFVNNQKILLTKEQLDYIDSKDKK